MDCVWIAQAVWDKASAVTAPTRKEELRNAFQSAGITVDADMKTVSTVSGESSFGKLGSALQSALPTAMISARRVLGQNNVNVDF